ncbi:helix-turn-helix domain-containing protein [Actinoplanes sp. NPDC026619]|uniref:ArsR/SmtB family transcription factor n=1 Tax=Actinoplanes sp. NPDC026619 TaxID=3155798 RepID=UPI0033C9EDB6
MAVARMHLTPQDIGKIRLLPEPNPVMEIMASTILLRETTTDPFLQGWRTRSSRALGRAAAPIMNVMGTRLFTDTDVITRHALHTESIDSVLDAFLATPRSTMDRDLAFLAQNGGEPARIESELRGGPRDAMATIAKTLTIYHRNVVAPQWDLNVRHSYLGFVEQRRRLAKNGVDWLLRNLHPLITWEPPFLTLHMACGLDPRQWGPCPIHNPTTGTSAFSVNGRGLVLVPSFFARDPMIWVAEFDDEPAVVLYPVAADWTALGNGTQRSFVELAPVMGRARAAILQVLAAGPCTTTDLARTIQVSVASASEHCAALRRASLVLSIRNGMSVNHSLTEMGAALLSGMI